MQDEEALEEEREQLIVSRCWAVFAGLLAAGQACFARCRMS